MTYHAKDGKFCNEKDANIVAKDGGKFQVIRELKPVGDSRTKRSIEQVSEELKKALDAG